MTGDEWREYRAIMAVFANTFFSEFSPEEVTARLPPDEPLDPAVVSDRLESLRRWGNLTVSSSVGNPSSLDDYYRRRNRYLITRAGQEVHELVEGVLSRVDEVRDVSTGRLRALLDALGALATADLGRVDPRDLADLVGAVFDPHQAFTSEITQFFAAINQWQSRYDLTPDEFTFFAEVLVGYVAERLDEIERTSRPIGRLLVELAPSVPAIVDRARGGLADRVAAAGLADAVAVGRRPGASVDDWEHLMSWFVGRAGRPSRIDQLGRDAVSAIRTLTLNLTRLSRSGIGAASRRADFVRLARMFDRADPARAPRIAVAAFGLHEPIHWAVVAGDAADPVASTTPWRLAPRAEVPVSLRERGDRTNRGRASPMRDRTQEARLLRHRREREAEAGRRVDAELLAGPAFGDRQLSGPAFQRAQGALARTLHRVVASGSRVSVVDGQLRCTLMRTPGRPTRLTGPEGTLVLYDLTVGFTAASDPVPDVDVDEGATGDDSVVGRVW